jgi:hypothetical protein
MQPPSSPSCCPPQATYPNLTVAHLHVMGRRYRPWLAMFEEGWSMDKIAEAWLESPETVAAVLNELTLQPCSRQSRSPSHQRSHVSSMP